MLNCTDELCHLHNTNHYRHLHLQDDPTHQQQVMSGDTVPEEVNVNELIQNILNGTESELSSLSHVDAPSDSLYVACGVLIAMLLVAVLILLLAFFISKLRKREEHRGDTPTHPHGVIQEAEHVVTPAHPPPFLWRYSGNNNNSSQFNLVNSSQDTLVTTVPCEDGRECKGFKKNLRGKLKKIVLKKPQEVYTIPAELRPQLKQIYVY